MRPDRWSTTFTAEEKGERRIVHSVPSEEEVSFVENKAFRMAGEGEEGDGKAADVFIVLAPARERDATEVERRVRLRIDGERRNCSQRAYDALVTRPLDMFR